MSLLLVLVACALAVPTWPSKYRVTGTFSTVPANQTVPFIVNWDEPNKRENLMYFNSSMDYTIWDGDDYYYIHVKKDAQECVTLGVGAELIGMTSILPDMTGYENQGTVTVSNVLCDHWALVDPEGDPETNNYRTNFYDMYVDHTTGAPVLFEIVGYNVIHGSHYSHYRFEYTDFQKDVNDRTAYTPPTICRTPVNSTTTSNRHTQMIRTFTQRGRMFSEHQALYGREYASENEAEMRRRIFSQNLETINAINARQDKWVAAPNFMADWTYDEIAAFRMGKARVESTETLTPGHILTSKDVADDLPTAIDWRVEMPEVVGRVKDQCACGSCWAFGALGTLEGRYAIARGLTVHQSMSEQFVVDCYWDLSSHGCNGGLSEGVLNWMVQNNQGVAWEMDYPYIGLDSWCHIDRAQPDTVPTDWGLVESGNVDALKTALLDGPVAVAIAVPQSMVWYSSGIYDDTDCGSSVIDLVHAVTAVGYAETSKGEGYWIIKNSWSTLWGEDGYIYISTTDNLCGVATDASYAVY